VNAITSAVPRSGCEAIRTQAAPTIRPIGTSCLGLDDLRPLRDHAAA
jgi:hypothetical protein